ncbi:MAG: hypothetical protein K6G00_07295 [Treponema sp.]|nr:hypothetical protein [Treponema sp.]
MKKRALLAFAILLVSLFPLFAASDPRKKDHYYDYKVPDVTFNISAGMNSGSGFEPYTFMVQPYVQLDTTYFQLYTGVQMSGDIFHATAGGVFWPFRLRRMRFGAGMVYHFSYFDDISLCHDLLFNFHYELRPAYWFGFKMNLGYFHKARRIFAVADYIGYITNKSTDFSFETDFFLPAKITLYTRMSSYEMFRYMVFCAPSFTFGVSKTVGKRLDITFETTSRYIDFFTASARYDDTEMRFILGLHL